MPPAKTRKEGLLDSWGRTGNRKHRDKICPVCGGIFRPRRTDSKYCSRPCLWSTNGGHNKKVESWWINPKGYIEGRITLSDGSQVRVKQHRYIVEGILGRPLDPWEDVHHKDGDKTNNNPENLEIIAHGDHSKLSNSLRDYKKGYSLNLSEEERKRRSLHAIATRLNEIGRTAIAKAKGE